LEEDIKKLIYEKELINPYIYTRIKNKRGGQTDYFLPVLYLDLIFKKDIIKEKNEFDIQNYEEIKRTLTAEQRRLYEEDIKLKKEQLAKELEEKKSIEMDYKKLIIEHNMNYFNEFILLVNNIIKLLYNGRNKSSFKKGNKKKNNISTKNPKRS
jgi:hypothetical protein